MWGGVISGRSIERDEKNVLISPFCSASKSRVVAFFLFFFCPRHQKKFVEMFLFILVQFIIIQ